MFIITLNFSPWLPTSMDVNIHRGRNPSRISSGAGAPKKVRSETTISICHFDFFGLGRPSALRRHFLACLVVFERDNVNNLIFPINSDKIQAGNGPQKKKSKINAEAKFIGDLHPFSKSAKI